MECLLSVNVSFSPVVSAVSWQADIECPGQIVPLEQLLLSIFHSFVVMGLESWHFLRATLIVLASFALVLYLRRSWI